MLDLLVEKCKVEIMTRNKLIGETIQNSYKISHQSNEIELFETVAPGLIIEKLKGKDFAFAYAFACALCTKFGTIQLCYLERIKNTDLMELVAYYSKSITMDEKMKEQIIFYHTQNNFNYEYLTSSSLMGIAKSYNRIGFYN